MCAVDRGVTSFKQHYTTFEWMHADCMDIIEVFCFPEETFLKL